MTTRTMAMIATQENPNLLLPLDGRGWLARDVQDYTIDSLNFIADSVGDSGKDLLRRKHPVGSHSIGRFNDSESGSAIIGSLIALDADRSNRQ
jgi:hypothetical protein